MSKGRQLAESLGLDCKQALYSEWGNFYAPIKNYPCVLFDKFGFVVVNSPAELSIQGIQLNKRTNVPNLISRSPGYQLIAAWSIHSPEEVVPSDQNQYWEGAVVSIQVNRYERDRKARQACLKHYGCICQACKTDLAGQTAANVIHVHHIKPVSSIGQAYQIDPIRDLRPLCPNCHTVAHLREDPYTVEELKAMIASTQHSNAFNDQTEQVTMPNQNELLTCLKHCGDSET